MSTNAKAAVLLAVATAAALYALRQKTSQRSIADEKVLIIGASSGVGLELAKEYARTTGNQVSLHIVARRSLDTLCQTLVEEGAAAVTSSQADVTSPSDVHNLASKLLAEWSRLDTVIIW